MQIATIGLDIAKNVFQVHGIDAAEKVVVRKQLRRAESFEARGVPTARGSQWTPVQIALCSSVARNCYFVTDGWSHGLVSVARNQVSAAIRCCVKQREADRFAANVPPVNYGRAGLWQNASPGL
jgi:hypothetical protein